jgi:uncharacterized protein (DUF1810 family)
VKDTSGLADPQDPFDLRRFVDAQADVYEAALAELKAGRKRTHWMWFIFPQLTGLASSVMAQRYAIRSRLEALAYLRHPILGPRLHECAEALLKIDGWTAEQIMGYPDYLKLRSSMTLFAAVAEAASPFATVLERYFPDGRDEYTLKYLAEH